MFKHYSHKELIASIIKHNDNVRCCGLSITFTKYNKVVNKIEESFAPIIIGSEPQYDGETTSVMDSIEELPYCYICDGKIKCSKENTSKIPQRYIPEELLQILNILYKDELIK